VATRLLLIVMVLLAITACGGESEPDGVLIGVVDQVTGDRDVEAFVLMDEAGNNYRFIPAPGLLCGGEPLEHLRAHLVERDQVTVTFERDESGVRIATGIDHRS
jgi:hypothetical protein